jgi:HTH-type transcriptional regulator/antitoxin HigA
MSKKQNEFIPDYAVPPGLTLLETIDVIGMSQAELAERTGRPKKTINEIIKGKAAITPETALQLERVLGVPASFWNNLERNYQETLARISEQKKLEQQTGWLNKVPVSELAKKGWITMHADKVQQLKEVLNFFGVASPDQLEARWFGPAVAFRKSRVFQSDPGAVAAWLRMGELLAQRVTCQQFAAVKFKNALQQIRPLTTQPPEVFHPEVERLCAEAGVAIVFVPELPNLRVSGATWWLNANKAIVQLSLRYKSDDQLWFSLFHEAGHIIRHGKKEVFIEDQRHDSKEKEADEFAADTLIPKEKYRRFVISRRFSKTAICALAADLDIAPGIVVGRLQHEGHLPHSFCNDLKCRLEWKA